MSAWRNLTNATATIYAEQVVDEVADGMGGTTDVTDWVAIHEDASVGFEPHTGYEWATSDGDDTDYAGTLFVPESACDDVAAGTRLDVTHRDETTAYRAEAVRVLDSPTGAHAEVAVVAVGDESGA